MRTLREWMLRLWGTLRRRRTDADLQEELRTHLEFAAEDAARQAYGTAGARRAARIRVGGVDETMDAARDQRGLRWLEDVCTDVRFSLRTLRRSPAFTAVVLVTLALGIGVNAAMFSLVDRLILSGPGHVRDVERVHRLQRTFQAPGRDAERTGQFGYVTYDSLRQRARFFEAIAAYGFVPGESVLGRGAGARRITRGHATASLFPLLGVAPAVGRFYTEQEDDVVAPEPVAVISYGLWQTEFGGRSDTLGASITVDDTAYRIVGVAPEGFTGPDLQPVDVWLPESLIGRGVVSQNWTQSWNASWLRILVRLTPDASADAAGAEATAIHRSVYTGTDEARRLSTLSLQPLRFGQHGEEPLESRIAIWLFAVSAIVLLVSCTNVVNLLLARGLGREREIALRFALGAGRARVVRLLLIEVAALAVAGGAVGLGIAYLVGTFVRERLIPDIEWTSGVVDARVVIVSFFVASAVGLLAGLFPAVRASAPNLSISLKTGSRGEGGRRSRARAFLTMAQAAMSTVLLVGAGLFVGSLHRARAADLGLEPRQVVTFNVRRSAISPNLDEGMRQRERARRSAFFRSALEHVAALPDVEVASLTIGLPFRSSFGNRIRIPGRDVIPQLAGGGPYLRAVTPDYFRTVGTRLLEGRGFSEGDRAGSAPVAIIGAAMASTLWPDHEALGKCFHIGTSPKCTEIVGISEDSVRFGLRDEPAMSFYIPFGQEEGIGGTDLLVRPRGDRNSVIPMVKQTLLTLDPSITFVDARSLQEPVDLLVRPWRLGATMFTLMGGLALVIAGLGLYSVLSYLVTQRTREIGVRMALGASPVDVVRLLVRSALTLAVPGVIAGGVVATITSPLLEPLLFDISPTEPRVFIAAAMTLVAAALLATIAPLRRARGVDPIDAIRTD